MARVHEAPTKPAERDPSTLTDEEVIAQVRAGEVVESIEPALRSRYELHLSRCDRVVAAVLRRMGGSDGHDRAR